MPTTDAMYRTLVETSPDAVLLIDEAGAIVFASPAAEDVFGYSPDALVGQSVERLVPAVDRAAHAGRRRDFLQQRSQRRMSSGTTVLGERADGSTVLLDVQLTPVDVDGRRLVAALARDISHIARLEEKLARLNAELRESLAESERRGAELADTNEQKNRLLGMAAHDLRNPLTAILSYADLLTTDLPGPLTAQQRPMVEHILRSAEYMAGLVDGVLDLASVQAGNMELRRHGTDVATLVARTIDVERVGAQAKGTTIELRAEPAWFSVDGSKLEQVVHNLVANAVKFSPIGSRVEVAVGTDGEGLFLVVTDQGPGLDESDQQDLFKPFSKGKTPATSGEKGAGLGLAIVYQIVRAHGGTITAGNAPGSGARFEVRIPAA